MKIEPIRSYRNRILRVYDYIKQNLAGDLSVNRLADVACLSPYHFHRVYRRLVGETLSGAARRCRLYQGGKLLAETPSSLAEIAYRTGYNRIDSFSRAFRQFYGMSPDHYRLHHQQQLSLVTAATSFGNMNIGSTWGSTGQDQFTSNSSWHKLYHVDLVELPRTELICLESDSTTEVLEPKFVDLNLHAQNYQLNTSSHNFLGIFYKDPEFGASVNFTHRYAVAALPINALQRERLDQHNYLPFKLQCIPQGLYASYIYTGPYSMSERSHEWLLGYWIRVNGMRACTAPIIEQYLNDPRIVLPSQLKTRVLIQVERI